MMIITSRNFYKTSLEMKASKWQLIYEDNDLAPYGGYYFYKLIGIRWWIGHCEYNFLRPIGKENFVLIVYIY